MKSNIYFTETEFEFICIELTIICPGQFQFQPISKCLFDLLRELFEIRQPCSHFREDAEAPKAKLVKPNSLSSSRSGSSRSGTSSTQSMVHIMGPQGQRGCVPAVAALKENCQASTFPQSPPGYNHTVPKTPEPRSTPTSTSTSNSNLKPSPPPKLSPGNLTRMGATPVMIPAQTKAFQTV